MEVKALADTDQNGSGDSGTSEREATTAPVLDAEQVIQELAVEMRRHADAADALEGAATRLESASTALVQGNEAVRSAHESVTLIREEASSTLRSVQRVGEESLQAVRQDATAAIEASAKAVQEVEAHSKRLGESLDTRFAQLLGLLRLIAGLAGAALVVGLICLVILLLGR
jgi:predicted  nucleic acid-binding Zn-ribbon protein